MESNNESKETKKTQGKQRKRTARKNMKLPKAFTDSQTEYTWLIQPTVMTFMQYDYTLFQSKVFLGIVDKLQDAIKEHFSKYYNHKYIFQESHEIQTSLFENREFYNPDSTESIRLSFRISDFGVDCTQYPDLKEALRTISTVQIKIPRKINGRDYEEFDNLCSTLVPKDARTEGDIVYIVIKKKTAERMLSINSGYTRYLKETVLNSETSYTPKIYTLLSLYKDMGQKKIRMKDLRALLRLENKYKVFRDFKKRVLDNVHKDLKRMAEAGIANFYIEWEKWYAPNQRKAGEPDSIIFTFHRADTPFIKEDQEMLQKYKDSIYNLLRSQNILMSEVYACEIREMVTLDNFKVIQEKISYTYEYIKKNRKIRDKGLYIYKSLLRTLSELNNFKTSLTEDIEEADFEELP